jgi:hypothetical protein
MSDLELIVNFRGLFTLVRHIAPPPAGQRVTSTEEPMSIVFAVDDQAEAAGSGTGHGHGGHTHSPLLRLPDEGVRNGLGALAALPRLPTAVDGWTTLDIRGKTLWLPYNGRYDPVTHTGDENIGAGGFDVACTTVGKNANWTPLTRLGDLHALTGTSFAVDVTAPSASLVQSTVRLSGGEIGCLRSYKALADAFFEFFDEHKTIRLQPGVEDVQYSIPANAEGFVPIGFGDLGAAAPAVVVEVSANAKLIIDSLPPQGAPHAADLNHFRNFYKLMSGNPRKPFVRVACRCEDGQIVHTMAGTHGIHRHFLDEGGGFLGIKVLTTPTCTCLVAMAYRPLSA